MTQPAGHLTFSQEIVDGTKVVTMVGPPPSQIVCSIEFLLSPLNEENLVVIGEGWMQVMFVTKNHVAIYRRTAPENEEWHGVLVMSFNRHDPE